MRQMISSFIEFYHDSSYGTQGIWIDPAGLYPAFGIDGLHLTGDIIETVVGRGGYGNGLLHYLHIW